MCHVGDGSSDDGVSSSLVFQLLCLHASDQSQPEGGRGGGQRGRQWLDGEYE